MGKLGRVQLRLGVVELCRDLEVRVRNMYTVLQGSKNHCLLLTKVQCVRKTKAQRSRICWASSTWNSKAIQEESYLQPVVRNPTCTFKNQKGAKNPKGRCKVNEGCTESYLNVVMCSHPDSLTLPSALHPFGFGGFHTWNAPASVSP